MSLAFPAETEGRPLPSTLVSVAARGIWDPWPPSSKSGLPSWSDLHSSAIMAASLEGLVVLMFPDWIQRGGLQGGGGL